MNYGDRLSNIWPSDYQPSEISDEIHAADLLGRAGAQRGRACSLLRGVQPTRRAVTRRRTVSVSQSTAPGGDGAQRADTRWQTLRDGRSVCGDARTTGRLFSH